MNLSQVKRTQCPKTQVMLAAPQVLSLRLVTAGLRMKCKEKNRLRVKNSDITAALKV